MHDLAEGPGEGPASESVGHEDAANASPPPVRRKLRRGIGLGDGPGIDTPRRDDYRRKVVREESTRQERREPIVLEGFSAG